MEFGAQKIWAKRAAPRCHGWCWVWTRPCTAMLQKIPGPLLRKLFHSKSSEKPEKIQSTLFTSFGAMTTATQKVFQTHTWGTPFPSSTISPVWDTKDLHKSAWLSPCFNVKLKWSQFCMKFVKHQHIFEGMANVDFSFTLDSCYMRTMTDVCSVFDNWSRGGRGHRPERGLENRFHRWKGMKFTHIGGEGGGQGCCKCNWPQATTGDEWIRFFCVRFECQTCSCNQWITGLNFEFSLFDYEFVA